jgi:hypothetical protein
MLLLFVCSTTHSIPSKTCGLIGIARSFLFQLERKLGAQKMMLLGGHKAPVVTCDWSTAIDCRTCLTGAMDGNVIVSTLLRH